MSLVRRRRELVLALVASRRIETQEELVEALRERGVAASQASVSRDVAALGLVKVDGRYAPPPPEVPTGDPREARVAAYLLAVASAGDHLLVLRTPPGEAPGVALAVDGLDLAGVVGTVAGDDTILVAVAGRKARESVSRRLLALSPGARRTGKEVKSEE